MAKRNENQVSNKPRVHGISLTGEIITAVAVATTLTLPFFGIGGGFVMGIAAAVSALLFVSFAVYRGRKRKAEKMGLAKLDDVKKVQETDENQEVKAKTKQNIDDLEKRKALQERLQNLDRKPENTPEKKSYTVPVSQPVPPVPADTNESQHSALKALDYYRTNEVKTKTFAVYESDGKTFKEFEGKPMIYKIEDDPKYRVILNNYIASEGSGACVIKVYDASGESNVFDVPAVGYSGVMRKVRDSILGVVKQLYNESSETTINMA